MDNEGMQHHRNRGVPVHSRSIGLILAGVSAVALLLSSSSGRAVTASTRALTGIQKIKHIVFIMQENRSFDSYFGLYPGADGFPRDKAGHITVCVPDPQAKTCVKPYHDVNPVNVGGPHIEKAALTDEDKGKMDGFIQSAESAGVAQTAECLTTADLVGCSDPAGEQGATCFQTGQLPGCVDVMGYHIRSDIPNYWKYADQYVLQDHMFEPVNSWSLPVVNAAIEPMR